MGDTSRALRLLVRASGDRLASLEGDVGKCRLLFNGTGDGDLYRLDEGLSYLDDTRTNDADRDRLSRLDVAYRRGESEKLADRERGRFNFDIFDDDGDNESRPVFLAYGERERRLDDLAGVSKYSGEGDRDRFDFFDLRDLTSIGLGLRLLSLYLYLSAGGESRL